MTEATIRENPFTYGNPISDPARLFGRRREIEQVFTRLRNVEFESSSIVGERRIGKTSILNYLAHPDVRRAAALAEIGEYGLADEMLRWQARIGDDRDHKPLLHLAARLDLPATQIWLAHNLPVGEVMEASARWLLL